ncbi:MULTISPECIES: YtxH domain-containing protein [Cohnella]|uniref:Gas vesicle protein n=1 Tax=Cohnella phaseoli TaxID=456490 RepID=A0A3D9I3Z0_9BACL|nr:YtxH domain-containing protein [Cohnella phaseoli]RED56503.1 gas vesicle protein [Cohnella phaseoli]
MTETNKAIKSAVIGGIIGAAAALLLAPKSGKELRGDIRERCASLQSRTKQFVADVGDKTMEVAQQVGEKTAEIADKTRSVLTTVKDEIREAK